VRWRERGKGNTPFPDDFRHGATTQTSTEVAPTALVMGISSANTPIVNKT
jgi:hypothetical protein